jgi:hypothetical protein
MFSKVGEQANMNEIYIQDWLTSLRSEFPYTETHIIDLYTKKTLLASKNAKCMFNS